MTNVHQLTTALETHYSKWPITFFLFEKQMYNYGMMVQHLLKFRSINFSSIYFRYLMGMHSFGLVETNMYKDAEKIAAKVILFLSFQSFLKRT